MWKSIKMFFLSFKVIDKKTAEELNLTFSHNVYGDAINQLNCRSIWKDENGREYRVKE